ncbi:hypothetical protein OUZ56_010147 [Daphnia magna]|uniref:Uncharacterized protein n=1 Tax=Daphnia magna TaxID=35525 RepID=A0ABR0AHY0_9CRUS|nr:hypothetical protein OUZ56_010147 [Daphnia magna]
MFVCPHSMLTLSLVPYVSSPKSSVLRSICVWSISLGGSFPTSYATLDTTYIHIRANQHSNWPVIRLTAPCLQQWSWIRQAPEFPTSSYKTTAMVQIHS